MSAALLVAALAMGAFSEARRRRPTLVVGDYEVLAADFHVHVHPLSWAALTPWDSVLEARRQGLDTIALTGHNHVWTAKVGRWFSRRIGGPTVLVSEEIHTPRYHMIAVGVDSTISWRLTAAAAIREVHRQGGVAIAAHPTAHYWAGWDSEAMEQLDAAEIVHPIVYLRPDRYAQLKQFFGRRQLTAIGSSDYHGLARQGICRTYVFVRENTEQEILAALREGRTAVYDRDGRAYGNPELIQQAAQSRLLPQPEAPPPVTWLMLFSRIAGAVGLVGLIVFGPRK
jgi:hypothetical protein